jgi:DNA helicase HerA-like ATPase
MENVTRIGITDWRNQNKPFGIKDADRLHHIYAIGKTGAGKSTLLQNMAIADIQTGKGLCVVDPHGDIAENLLHYVPKERIDQVIYFDATDTNYSIAFNPLHGIKIDQQHLALAGLIATFKKIWIDSWGPRLEYILRYSLLSLMAYPKATLLDIQPLLTNYDFRRKVLAYCTNQQVHSFWHDEFDKYPPALKAEAISPILNKTGLFSAIAPLRNIVGQITSSVQLQDILDNGKILICNLAKGKIGEDASTLLGSMLVNGIQLAALARASQPEYLRKPFYLYVDEMHSFVSLSFADILAEARKYGLSLFLTHQYIEQLDERIRSAIFGNVGTLISFRIGAKDAEYLAKEFHPAFSEDDLVNLPRYSMYLKLMIDGATSKPFSAAGLPLQVYTASSKGTIIHLSQCRYGREKEVVNKEIYLMYPQRQNEDEQGTLFK